LSLEVPEPPAQAEILPAPVEKTSSLALPPNYKPIPIPDAPAISQALLLARALRPLARQIAVGLPTVVDEIATVDFIAETGISQLVLKAESELWLDVALVFDTSSSMCLWQRLGSDVHRLLARYGEFRDVRIWRLRHTPGKVELTDRKGVPSKPKELLTGDRRLIAIVSDCVAPAWHDGRMRDLVAIWAVQLPTVVFQVFPERLWSRTALARSITVELQGQQPTLPNDKLKPFARSVWDRDRLKGSVHPSHIRLPVVTLEKDSLDNWAKVVAGDRRARVLGIVWDAAPVIKTPTQSTQSTSTLKDRIDAFVLTASPLSRELAARLASAPVITLPIVRIIKASMPPHLPVSAVHIAEVLMSGLLKVSGSQTPTFENAERIVYELVDDEVRDRLRAGSLVGDSLNVFSQVSSYIAQGLGKSVNEFWALVRTPGMGQSFEETEFLSAFATVSAKVLRGLGSEFEAIANQILPATEVTNSAAEFNNFPLEDLEYEVAKLINFPTLQTCEYESAAITAILDRFDFETAALVRSPTLLNRQKFKIQRRRATSWGYAEPLSMEGEESIALDMIAIPGGRFRMGAPESESKSTNDERPQHEVTLSPFYLSRYPIIQVQWRIVAGYEPIDRELDPDPSRFKGDRRPVEKVSWYDAQEFCQRLSQKTGWLYRLPSESEWEYSCRAGTETSFHFGETITPELVNYDGTPTYSGDSAKGEYRQRTTEVGTFPANEWGLHDMHGNVWEWCEDDWHKNYEGAPIDGRAWLEPDREEAYRLLRGGSWYDLLGHCRSASRSYGVRGVRDYGIGFRVLCLPPRLSS
jgi:formylglycine-generating enzyme required for sulfatase activity